MAEDSKAYKKNTTLLKPDDKAANSNRSANKSVRDKLANDIKTGKFEHIYLLCGDDGYLRKNFADALIKALVPEDDELNFTSFAGNNIDGADIVSICETMPFLAERRVVYVENTGHFRLERNAEKPGTEALANFLATLPDTTILIFNDENIDKRLKLYKAIKKSDAYIAELNHRTPAELVTWIATTLKRQGVLITQEAAQALIGRVGIDMYTLKNELDKLVAYNGDKKGITLDDVREISTSRIDDVYLELFTEAAKGNVSRAMDIYRSVLASKEEPIKIIIGFGKSAAEAITAFDMLDDRADDVAIASVLKCRPGAIHYKRELKRFCSRERLERILHLSSTLNEEIVSGNMEPDLAAEVMISSILA